MFVRLSTLLFALLILAPKWESLFIIMVRTISLRNEKKNMQQQNFKKMFVACQNLHGKMFDTPSVEAVAAAKVCVPCTSTGDDILRRGKVSAKWAKSITVNDYPITEHCDLTLLYGGWRIIVFFAHKFRSSFATSIRVISLKQYYRSLYRKRSLIQTQPCCGLREI